MTLSTVDPGGLPDARVLILKDLDARGWWFAGSSASAKGRQLAGSPLAALTFHWKSVGRQVRLRGAVTPGTAAESRQDYLARSASARALTPELDWTVYALRPTHVEFWQADAERRHHRLCYERAAAGGWVSRSG